MHGLLLTYGQEVINARVFEVHPHGNQKDDHISEILNMFLRI